MGLNALVTITVTKSFVGTWPIGVLTGRKIRTVFSAARAHSASVEVFVLEPDHRGRERRRGRLTGQPPAVSYQLVWLRRFTAAGQAEQH